MTIKHVCLMTCIFFDLLPVSAHILLYSLLRLLWPFGKSWLKEVTKSLRDWMGCGSSGPLPVEDPPHASSPHSSRAVPVSVAADEESRLPPAETLSPSAPLPISSSAQRERRSTTVRPLPKNKTAPQGHGFHSVVESQKPLAAAAVPHAALASCAPEDGGPWVPLHALGPEPLLHSTLSADRWYESANSQHDDGGA